MSMAEGMALRWRRLLDDPAFFATAGAGDIGARVAEALLACIQEEGDLGAACEEALRLKPAMATVHRAVAAARSPDPPGALADYLRRAREALPDLARHGAALIPEGARVLVHSRSRAVLAVLREAVAQGRRPSAWVTTGWPLGEGRDMAADLRDAGVPVTLVPDAALAVAATRTSLALVGADAVLPDGSVVNKVGTHLLALAARAAGVPLYVCAETLKFWPEDAGAAGPPGEDGDPAELQPPPGVACWNPLFERVPAHLVTALATEDGVRHPARPRTAEGNGT